MAQRNLLCRGAARAEGSRLSAQISRRHQGAGDDTAAIQPGIFRGHSRDAHVAARLVIARTRDLPLTSCRLVKYNALQNFARRVFMTKSRWQLVVGPSVPTPSACAHQLPTPRIVFVTATTSAAPPATPEPTPPTLRCPRRPCWARPPLKIFNTASSAYYPSWGVYPQISRPSMFRSTFDTHQLRLRQDRSDTLKCVYADTTSRQQLPRSAADKAGLSAFEGAALDWRMDTLGGSRTRR